MKPLLYILALLAVTLPLLAQSNAPVRLAVISDSDKTEKAADLLTAQLSGNPGIQLLERDQIAKIYREQGLSAANSDYISLGQLLGADGLLFVATGKEGTQELLNIRLVAAKPGVVVTAEKLNWPVKDPTEWAALFSRHLGPLLPKLMVPAGKAIPLSLLEFRSAIQSSEERETERQATLLAIERLSREPQIFVLERRQLQSLKDEKDLQPTNNPAFWNGSYLLDGVLDENGYSPEKVTLEARLTPPKGGSALAIAVSGSRTNLAELVKELTVAIGQKLRLNSPAPEWDAAAEAARYFEEAKWAYRWGLFTEAQEAAESSWALGNRTMAVADLRLQCCLAGPLDFFRLSPPRYYSPPPDPANLRLAEHTLELFDEGTRLLTTGADSAGPAPVSVKSKDHATLIENGLTFSEVFSPADLKSPAFAHNPEWFFSGLKALNLAGSVLQQFCQSGPVNEGDESELAELRSQTRHLVTLLESNLPPNRTAGGSAEYSLNSLKWVDGGRWRDHPEDALPWYRQLLQSGYRPDTSADFWNGPNPNLPPLAGWSEDDALRVRPLLSQFAISLQTSTDEDLQLEGGLETLILTPRTDVKMLASVQQKLYDGIWRRRQNLFTNGMEATIVGRIRESLARKFELLTDDKVGEPFDGFQRRLRQDYLANNQSGDFVTFGRWFGAGMTDEDRTALRPLFEDFKTRLKIPASEALSLESFWRIHGHDQSLPPEVASPPAENSPALNPSPSPSPIADGMVPVPFTPWPLDLPPMNPAIHPVIQSAMIRNGNLWATIVCCGFAVPINSYTICPVNFGSFFASVDPATGTAMTIPFPKEFGQPGRSFEVTGDSLYAIVKNGLNRYSFQTRQWQTMHIPLEGETEITELGGRLYLATRDDILEVTPDTQAIQIIASSRRRPAANQLDDLGGFARISTSGDGRILSSAQRRPFAYSPEKHTWEELSDAIPETRRWHIKSRIQFQKDGLPIDPMNLPPLPIPDPAKPGYWPPSKAFWVDAPQGRIAVSPGIMGHWLIPKTALVSRVEELQKAFRTP